ncbi:MAG: cytochrome c [Desulfofustis sp.]|nr:cytochrome c [Desulfofustis sp.]NNK56418.1 cytochrome c [Desulfofustis sp.]
MCHGERGDGLRSNETGPQMDSPNLEKCLLTHTDGDFFWKIQNGRGDMPSFRNELSEEEI